MYIYTIQLNNLICSYLFCCMICVLFHIKFNKYIQTLTNMILRNLYRF